MSTIIIIIFVAAVVFLTASFTSNLWLPRSCSTENQSIESSPFRPSRALVLHSTSGPYTVTDTHPRPKITSRELLIRNHYVGLNPIDWKCVTYGFGIHALPWVSGRECAGTVQEVGAEVKGWQVGERVWVCSTNYRDIRTSTFQEVSALFFPHDEHGIQSRNPTECRVEWLIEIWENVVRCCGAL